MIGESRKNAKTEKVGKKSPSPEDLERETRNAAQRIFNDRQARNLDGDEVSDWLAAEAEIKQKYKLS